jgi:hypothetical protein
LELGKDRRGKILGMAMKYWPRILQMNKGELTKRCFKWQLDNMKFGSWTKKN